MLKTRLHRLFLLSRTGMRLLAGGRWDLLSYGLRMRLRGFDFGSVDLGRLGLDPDRCNHYADSGGPDLARVLREVNIAAGSRAVDFGSGKGGAALTLSEFPFEEIVGIELSEDLIRIAEANRDRAAAKTVHFLRRDAAEFTDLNRFTHFYMYHPFPCPIVEAVCANLADSLRRCPRDATLIYKNPVCDQSVMQSALFQIQRDFKCDAEAPDWTRFRVYLHRDGTGK